MTEEGTIDRRDWLNHQLVSVLLWKLPAAIMVVTAFLDIGSMFRAIFWAGSLFVMSGGCFMNAARCGRLHCYLTGPFFLVMALVSLLHGFDMIPLRESAWLLIGVVTVVGGIGLTYIPEWAWGRYVKRV